MVFRKCKTWISVKKFIKGLKVNQLLCKKRTFSDPEPDEENTGILRETMSFKIVDSSSLNTLEEESSATPFAV